MPLERRRLITTGKIFTPSIMTVTVIQLGKSLENTGSTQVQVRCYNIWYYTEITKRRKLQIASEKTLPLVLSLCDFPTEQLRVDDLPRTVS